jgi:hypothetical protein
MSDEKTLFSYIVDFAQIVSAISTAAAVVVSLWLARRAETQRLFIKVNLAPTIRKDPLTTEMPTNTDLTITIINRGVLPTTIYFVRFFTRTSHESVSLAAIQTLFTWLGIQSRFISRPIFASHYSPHLVGKSPYKTTLNYGEYTAFSVTIEYDSLPWKKMPNHWWIVGRSYFEIHTSLKAYRKRVPFSVGRRIQKGKLHASPML